MMDAATKLRQFHSTTPVWAKEDRAVLLASADHIEAQAERIRVLREALYALRLAREQDKYPSWEKGVPEFNKAETLADAALEATK